MNKKADLFIHKHLPFIAPLNKIDPVSMSSTGLYSDPFTMQKFNTKPRADQTQKLSKHPSLKVFIKKTNTELWNIQIEFLAMSGVVTNSEIDILEPLKPLFQIPGIFLGEVS